MQTKILFLSSGANAISFYKSKYYTLNMHGACAIKGNSISKLTWKIYNDINVFHAKIWIFLLTVCLKETIEFFTLIQRGTVTWSRYNIQKYFGGKNMRIWNWITFSFLAGIKDSNIRFPIEGFEIRNTSQRCHVLLLLYILDTDAELRNNMIHIMYHVDINFLYTWLQNHGSI